MESLTFSRRHLDLARSFTAATMRANDPTAETTIDNSLSKISTDKRPFQKASEIFQCCEISYEIAIVIHKTKWFVVILGDQR